MEQARYAEAIRLKQQLLEVQEHLSRYVVVFQDEQQEQPLQNGGCK